MKKRIAFISDHASPLATLGGKDSGGQNVYVAEVAMQLALMGNQIDIYTRCEHPSREGVVLWKPNIRSFILSQAPKIYSQRKSFMDISMNLPPIQSNL